MSSINAAARTGFVTIAVAVTMATLATAASAAVFGRDDRVPLPAVRKPLASSIGTLTSSTTHALCSAFCVAPGVIATASHCVFGTNEENRPPLSSLKFELRDAAGAPSSFIAGRAIDAQSQNVIAGTNRLSLAPPIGAALDWAVVKLENPVCGAGGLPISGLTRKDIEAAATSGGLYQVALHRDIAALDLQYDHGCATAKSLGSETARLSSDFADWRKILLHSCDTGGGSSGSPMLIDRNGRPEVVAINVGVYVASRGLISAAIGDHSPREPIANTAIDINPMARALKQLFAGDLVSTPDEVTRIQRRLQALLIYKGAVTGRIDAALKAAVRTWERRRFRVETGLLTKGLLEDLELPAGFVANR